MMRIIEENPSRGHAPGNKFAKGQNSLNSRVQSGLCINEDITSRVASQHALFLPSAANSFEDKHKVATDGKG